MAGTGRHIGFCDSLDAFVDADSVKRAAGKLVSPVPRTKGEAIDAIADLLDAESDANGFMSIVRPVVESMDAQTLRDWLAALEEQPARTKAENVAILCDLYVGVIVENLRLDNQRSGRKGSGSGAKRPASARNDRYAASGGSYVELGPSPQGQSGAPPRAVPVAPLAPSSEAPWRDPELEFLIVEAPVRDMVSSLSRTASQAFGSIVNLGRRAALTRISAREAAESGLEFEGGLQYSVVYVRDPYDDQSSRYLPVENASSLLASATISKFHELVSALGARRVEILHLTKNGGEADAAADVEFLTKSIGVEARFSTSARRETRLVTTYAEPKHKPHVPAGMDSFLRSMPQDLRSLVNEARLGNLVSKELDIVDTQAQSFAKRLKGIEGLGTLAASLASTTERAWRIRVDFAESVPGGRSHEGSAAHAGSPAGSLPPRAAPAPPPPASPPPFGAHEYFVIHAGSQVGPIGIEQLRSALASGQLTAETPMWRQGLPGWGPARAIPELAYMFGGPPPYVG
jgi:hypothetical protein